MNRKRVHGSRKFAGKRRINHAVTLDTALSLEGWRYDINTEMRFAACPVAGMAFVQVRFVHDFEAFRRESFAQLVDDNVASGHDGEIGRHPSGVNGAFRSGKGFAMSRLEAFRVA